MKLNDTKIECLYDLTHTIAKDMIRSFTYPWEVLANIEKIILELGCKLPKDEYEARENNVWIHKTATVFPSAYLGKNVIVGKDMIRSFTYPWEVLANIEKIILELGCKLPKDEYEVRENNVWIHKTATVFPSAYLGKNVIVGKGAEVRHCAFVRENAIIGEAAVVGNSTELKNVILFDGVEVPHYNYVGDSILGYKAHMGAGSITSNVRADKGLVKIHTEDGDIETGRKKVGAMLGDHAEIGCGSVLNPGTVIGRNSNVYPLSSVRCCVSENSIYKNQGEIAEKTEEIR